MKLYKMNKKIKLNLKKDIKKNSIFKSIIIGLLFIGTSINIFATSHLPAALLNLQNQTNEYMNMTTYFILPFYSLLSIINPLYLLLTALFLIYSILYFKKKSDHITFIISFLLANTLTYFFQAGRIGIIMANFFGEIMGYISVLILLIGVIFTILIGLKKINSSNLNIKFLASFMGVGLGLFFFQIPEKITIALKFALSYNPYFLRFVFSFKILFFLIVSLIPMIYLIHIIKYKKYIWAKNTHKFIIKNKDLFIKIQIGVLIIILILAYIYRNYLIS